MTSRQGRIAFAVTCALLTAPALAADVPPLSDLPNHLARLHVLASPTDSPLRTMWRPAWDALPNLALDLPGVLLAPLLGVERFGRLFLVATILLWCVACRSLGRALLGRDDLRALVACALVWSEPLLLGYVGFTFGSGLALLSLAAVARGLAASASDPSAARREIGIASVWGLAAAVSHAAAAAILVASVVALLAADVAKTRPPRRAVKLGALSLAPACLYLLQWWLRAASSEGTSFATPGMVARALISPITGLDALLDQASLGLLAVLGAVALVRARPLALRPGPALASLACAVLVAIFPSDVAGGIEVHGRFAAAAWVLALFAVDARSPVAAGRALAIAVLALFAARTLHLVGELRALDAEAVAIRTLLARSVPRGASLATVWFFPADGLPAAERVRALATLHVPALAVVDRGAHVPSLYALPGVQPLRYLGGLPRRHRFAASDRGPVATDLLARFDRVWLCGGPATLERDLLGQGEELGRVGRCILIASRREELASHESTNASGERERRPASR